MAAVPLGKDEGVITETLAMPALIVGAVQNTVVNRLKETNLKESEDTCVPFAIIYSMVSSCPVLTAVPVVATMETGGVGGCTGSTNMGPAVPFPYADVTVMV